MLDINKSHSYKCNKFYKQDINPTGFLSITVLNRLNNRPVPFAEVSAYHMNIRGVYGESGEGNLVVKHITDKNGKVPLIELPVLERNLNESFTLNFLTNTAYFLTVRHFKYHSVNLMNIQIYPNITTIFNVFLTQLTPLQPRRYEFIITPEKKNIRR